jgi:hypothetical protein
MDKKTQGILFTLAAVVLCGCPGIVLCLFGALAATGIRMSGQRPIHPVVGIALVCLAVIFIAIPIVVGFVTLRNKPASSVSNEPLPPAS